MSSTIEITKTCEWCHSVFTARKCTTRYCSKRCAEHAYKDAKRKEHVAKEQAKANIPQNLDESPFISPSQCARLLGVSRRSVYNYLAANSIPCFQFKGKTLISRESLNTLFDSSHLRKRKKPLPSSTPQRKFWKNSVSAIHGCSRQRKKITFRRHCNEVRPFGARNTLTASLPVKSQKRTYRHGTLLLKSKSDMV